MKAFTKTSMISILVTAQQTIFISYSSADTEMAKTVYTELRAKGFAPWMAGLDVPAGANYAQTIIEALQSSSAVIIILTKSAIESQHVKREVNVAIDQNIPLFPLNLSGKADVLPLLSLDWKYWLTIIQILNCKDAISAANQFMNAYKPKHDKSTNNLPLTSAKDLQQEREEREKKAREIAAFKERKAKERREKAEAIKLEEIRLAKEAKEREVQERREAEQKRIEDEKKRVASAAPRIEQARKSLTWLKELTNWLTDVALSNDEEDHNFDLKDFEKTFHKSFISELKGIEDLAGYIHREIGQELLYIYRLFSSYGVFTGEEPERALKYLRLAVEHSNPWAFIAEAEYSLAVGDEKSKQSFFGKNAIDLVNEYAKQASRYWSELLPEGEAFRHFHSPPSPGDSKSDDKKLQDATRKEFIFTWEWLSLLYKLTLKESWESNLPSLLSRIEDVLARDSYDPLSSDVYLSASLRRRWVFLESLVLMRQHRERAAKENLKQIKINDEESVNADIYFRSLLNLAKGDNRSIFSELLNAMSLAG